MKLKSLLAIVSCSAIALSISVPSIAETLKESKVESSSIGIGNKDYRNKQSTPSIVGNWKSSVSDNEYRQTNPIEIYKDYRSDGTTTYAFRHENGNNGFANNPYQYKAGKDGTGLLVEQGDEEGEYFVVLIEWISNDEFVVTLLKDSIRPHRNGVQRRFVRIDEPVATTLQQRAQQAAATSRNNASSRRTRELQNEIKTNTQRQQMVLPMFSGGLYK